MDKWMLAFFTSIILFTAGCNGFNKEDKSAVNTRILSEAPFSDLTDSIERFPKDASLYERRGLLLSQNNFHALATLDYKKAWTIHPDENTALLYTSSLFIEGRHKEVVDLLRESVKQFPQNAELRRRLSEAYLQQGKPKEALEQYNEILASNPENFEAWYEKAAISAQAKDTPTAISCLEKAYSLEPLQLYGVSLANLYAETKNVKTLALCDELIAKDSAEETGDAFFIKGIYYANMNESKLALDQFETCIKRDWKFTDAYIEKGILLFEEKNIDEAINTFSLASRVSNTNPDAYYWLGRCYESIGKEKEAKENYFRAVALDKKFTEAKDALERLNKK